MAVVWSSNDGDDGNDGMKAAEREKGQRKKWTMERRHATAAGHVAGSRSLASRHHL